MTWTRVLRAVFFFFFGIFAAAAFSSCSGTKNRKAAPPEGYSFMEGDDLFFSDSSVDAELEKIDGLPTPNSYAVAENSRPSELVVGRSGRPVSQPTPSGEAPIAKDTPPVISKPVAPQHHIVGRGETLWGISKKYGTTVDALMAANNLSSPSINISQKLLLGGGATVLPQQGLKAAPPQSRKHTVASGDTLWGLSKKYGTTVDRLMAANKMSSPDLPLGITLQIP